MARVGPITLVIPPLARLLFALARCRLVPWSIRLRCGAAAWSRCRMELR
jgi:hypothetical protein